MKPSTTSAFLLGIGLTGVASAGPNDTCQTASNTAGCSDLTCETAVCAMDSYCCSTAWDDICVSEAEAVDQCGSVEAVPEPGVEILLTLMDPYGDGWNGNAITIWNSLGEPIGEPITLAAGAEEAIALYLVPDTYSVSWSATLPGATAFFLIGSSDPVSVGYVNCPGTVE